MSDDSPRSTIDTGTPARNFTLSVDDKVRALTKGPPAYAVRRRRIEDTEASIVAALAVWMVKRRAQPPLPLRIERGFEELKRLVDAHNRYYPIEANLPIDPRSGLLFDHGAPWSPMPAPTMEALRARAEMVARAKRR